MGWGDHPIANGCPEARGSSDEDWQQGRSANNNKTKVEVDGAKVFSADMTATNGVVHSIGKVLVPKSLDEFAGLDR